MELGDLATIFRTKLDTNNWNMVYVPITTREVIYRSPKTIRLNDTDMVFRLVGNSWTLKRVLYLRKESEIVVFSEDSVTKDAVFRRISLELKGICSE